MRGDRVNGNPIKTLPSSRHGRQQWPGAVAFFGTEPGNNGLWRGR